MDKRQNSIEVIKDKYIETKRIIQEAMRERRLVLFVGAGLSYDAGIPLWGAAVKEIADRLQIDTKGTLDYLKIPQYYCNTRGYKEYAQLMRKIFRYNEKLSTQPVHKLLMKFDVDTIITTNYDCLIEKAFEENNEFIQVISCDSDLPYKKLGKELIKMHGDFEHKNFVLKEEDYLSYHENFKLIENYIKSLIGTKVVLFMGYSLDDPDVKHIFTWVKDILDDNMQRAYMIEAGTPFDQYKSEYFRNLGVNIIYATELLGNKVGKISDNLLNTLKYLLKPIIESKESIGVLYDRLKVFKPMNYIYRRSISNALSNYRKQGIDCWLEDDGFIHFFGDKKNNLTEFRKLKAVINGKNKETEGIELNNILSRSSLKGLVFSEIGHKLESCKNKSSDAPKWFGWIVKFDYKSLWELKESNGKILTENDPEKYLLQAYLCNMFGDYLSAYYCLENASKYYYRKNEYVMYFISLWNKRNTGLIISQDMFYNHKLEKDLLSSIKRETDAIDLDSTIRSFSSDSNNDYSFLFDLMNFKFSSDLFYDVFSDSVKASKESKEIYLFHSGIPAYGTLCTKVYDYYNYCTFNYLIVDRYRENSEIYNLYVRSILASVIAPDIKGRADIMGIPSENVHASCLGERDIHLILRHISYDELKKMFNEYRIKYINISEDAITYLDVIAKNLLNSIDIKNQRLYDVYLRLLCLLAHVRLDAEVADIALKIIARMIEKSSIITIKDVIVGFLNSIYKQELFCDENLCELNMKLAIDSLRIIYENSSLIDPFHYIIYFATHFSYRGKLFLEDERTITDLLSEEYLNILADIYECCNERIRHLIKESFKEWSCQDSITGYLKYANAVLAGIIEGDIETEQRAYRLIEKDRNDREQQKKKGIFSGSTIDIEGAYANLYLLGMLKDKEGFKGVVKSSQDNLLRWLVDWQNYDYDKFDLDWLLQCSSNLLRKIANNRNVKESILSSFKNNYKKELTEQRIVDIIFEYFL